MNDIKKIKQLANNIRKHAVTMTSLGGSSHIGSILSIADILAVLYGSILKYKSKNPKWIDRDRFILSKGHAGAGVYAALAECGFMPLEKLKTHYQDGSDLSGHVSHKGIPGVEFSTGSLGHGLPVASGMALAAKINKKKHRVFVLLSDGECDEGTTWESALFASHNKLDNLIVLIDYNKIQSFGRTNEILNLEPIEDKWKSFKWSTQRINGHNFYQLDKAIKIAYKAKIPSVIICDTIKGKGVTFMENNLKWHYKNVDKKELIAAKKEINNEK